MKSIRTNISTLRQIVELIPGHPVVFDKAYVDFKHLHVLTERNVFWVTRSKDNMQYRTALLVYVLIRFLGFKV